jgi:S1-C subfamily serine protease
MSTRRNPPLRALLSVVVLTAFTPVLVSAQAPGVPVYEARDSEKSVGDTAMKLRKADKLVSDAVLTNHFSRRTTTLELPAPKRKTLEGRELWAAARAAHMRVGWHYLCSKCDQWHLSLAGGYAVTENGAVATCRHVVERPENFKEGFLVAADDKDNVFPVAEILASNPATDACLIKVDAKGLKPLPLSTDVGPGDRAFCFSWPLSQRGYFSEGIVNRFISRTQRKSAPTGRPVPAARPSSTSAATPSAMSSPSRP